MVTEGIILSTDLLMYPHPLTGKPAWKRADEFPFRAYGGQASESFVARPAPRAAGRKGMKKVNRALSEREGGK